MFNIIYAWGDIFIDQSVSSCIRWIAINHKLIKIFLIFEKKSKIDRTIFYICQTETHKVISEKKN